MRIKRKDLDKCKEKLFALQKEQDCIFDSFIEERKIKGLKTDETLIEDFIFDYVFNDYESPFFSDFIENE